MTKQPTQIEAIEEMLKFMESQPEARTWMKYVLAEHKPEDSPDYLNLGAIVVAGLPEPFRIGDPFVWYQNGVQDGKKQGVAEYRDLIGE